MSEVQAEKVKVKLNIKPSIKPKILKSVDSDTVSEVSNVSYLGKTIEDTYQDKTLKNHILSDPDTYAGSIEPQEEDVWCIKETEGVTVAVKERVKFIECFYKLFDEIIVNAIDQHKRLLDKIASLPEGEKSDLKPVKKISVNIDETTGVISVENDGEGLDVAMHGKFKLYVPEVVFGSLLTSINYDTSEERTVGGKNGYGAKITNIFSSEFTVETVDWRRKLLYKQTFRDNMTIVEPPVISKYTLVPFTRITYRPDFKRFSIPEQDIQKMGDWKLIKKRVYDASACTDKSVSVFLNGAKIAIKDFEEYINLYIGNKTVTKRVFSKVNDRWQVGVCLNDTGDFEQVSFVNSINTDRGGRHVNHIIDNLSKKICTYISEKDKKKIEVKPAFIKQNLFVFVQSTIVNPKFDTQTKRKLVSNVENFGSRCELDDEFIAKVVKLGILERATQLAEFKAKQGLDKKTDGNARARKVYHPKLIEGSCAGPNRPKGTITTIVFTEGDSAAGFMGKGLKGIPDSEHKYWSYFPLRGKLLNIRTATMKQLETNEEIMMIKKIIGLKDGETYTDTKQLRYDRVMILTDADKDGFHIKGLIMNFFSFKWPSLLKLQGFICDMSTPITKAIKSDSRNKPIKTLEFFSEPEYHEWAKSGTAGWQIKYYKGLGTYEPYEAKALCQQMRLSNFAWDSSRITYKSEDRDATDHQFELVFAKKYEDDRKDWLNDGYEPNPFAASKGTNTITYLTFLNNHQKLFSQADNVRSIPNIMDGFKPGQRKVIFCVLKRNLTRELKLSQLAGYISEHGAYHHGETSLEGTIVNMAQDYVGHGNYNLLFPSGIFGSRMGGGPELKKGEDAAAARYISTYMNFGTKSLFNQADNMLLEGQEEEGLKIEPKFYIPILPLILINGATGIGTGYSTTIQCYNPKDIIENIKLYNLNLPMKEMTPWYRGYNGKIIKLSEGKFITVGSWTKLSENKIRITELPVGTNMCKSFKGYVEFLNSILDQEATKKHIPDAKGKKPVKPKSKLKTAIKAKTSGAEDEESIKEPPADKSDSMLLDYDIIKATDTELIVELLFKDNILERELLNNEDFHFEKKLKLAFTFTTNNMHLYNAVGIIKRYETPCDIIKEFASVRMGYYTERKSYVVENNKNEYLKINTQYRFITEIINNVITINKKPKKEVVHLLETADPPYPKYAKTSGFKKTAKPDSGISEIEDGDDSEDSEDSMAGSYNYLLNLSVSCFTQEKLAKLKQEADKLYEICKALEAKSPLDMWTDEMDEFSKEYDQDLTEWANRNSLTTKIALKQPLKLKSAKGSTSK